MADMSKKSDAQLKKIMNADSGADAKTARAAYKELTKRKGDLGFSIQLILGGRDEENPKAPPKRPTNIKKKAKGGLIEPTANQTGLKKLPTAVRNKMGYLYGGGMAKKKKTGSMDYRKGGLIIMISEAKTKKGRKK